DATTVYYSPSPVTARPRTSKRERTVMHRLIGSARLGPWVFVSIAIVGGPSGAAVVLPDSPNPALKSVADRVHALAVLLRARAVGDPGVGDARLRFGAVGDTLGVLTTHLTRADPGEEATRRLRTDRALRPPFWGGPLFDARGRLVGLNTPPAGDVGTAVPASL